MVSTDEDPNGNLAGTFGGLENGLTGDSGGYRHDYVDLTPYAGSTIQLRLRYLTDPAFEERGWFADDFSVTADGTRSSADDVEGGLNGWTAEDGSLAGTTGAGWVQTSGAFDYEQYYIAEWRNFDGYDKGLKTPYTTVYQVGDEWKVKRTPYNAPGLLIWQRDASNSFNDISNNLFDPPSIGSKGTVLLVDAHYEPARLSGKAAEANPSGLDNLASRQQANDVAFGKVGRYPFTYCYPDSSNDPYGTYCNRFGKRAPVTSLHRRQDLVSGHRVPARSGRGGPVLLPGQRRLDGRAVAGQRALLHPSGRQERQGALPPVRHRTWVAATCSAPETRPTDARRSRTRTTGPTPTCPSA